MQEAVQQAARCLVLSALALAGFGCRDAAQETNRLDSGADSPTSSTTDSAGVKIVRISDLQDLDLPELNRRLLHSTLADLELYRVTGAVFLTDSLLAVANAGSSQVLLLDQQGSLLERRGRQGEGPGEYVDIAWIGVDAEGTLTVFDDRLRRITFLDAAGSATGVRRVEVTEALVPLVGLASGEFLAVVETRPFRPLGLQRGPLFLVLIDDAGAVVDTLGRWAGKQRHVTPDRMIEVGFAATALYAGRGRHAAIATTDSLDVTLYESSTPLTRIRGGHSPRRVTSGEKEAWTELVLDLYPEAVRPAQRRTLEQSTVRDTYPAFGALKVAADGAIWIGGYADLDDAERNWTVLRRDGVPLGRLSLPVYRPELLKVRETGVSGWAPVELETTIPSASHELLDVAADRIAVLRTSELGEEFVEVYAIDLPR